MEDSTLVMLANEVRGKTLRLLAGVTDEQARFTGGMGLNNSILWHAGHALVLVEHLALVPANSQVPAYPADWFNIFGAGSQPATVQSWPTLAEVIVALQRQQSLLATVLTTVRTERLDQVIDAQRNRTLRYSILHALHDEACHSGEIHLLKKLWERRGG